MDEAGKLAQFDQEFILPNIMANVDKAILLVAKDEDTNKETVLGQTQPFSI